MGKKNTQLRMRMVRADVLGLSLSGKAFSLAPLNVVLLATSFGMCLFNT